MDAVALALAAVSIAGGGSLFGFSNRGKRVHPAPSVRHVLDGQFFRRLGIPYATYRLDTFKLLALRHGIGLYTARTKHGNRRCYFKIQGQNFPSFDCAPYAGQFALPERVARADGVVSEQVAWMKAHPFPSPARPLMDMSELSTTERFVQLVGLAADGVRSIQLLALSDCHPIVTVPVINNVYIDAHTPRVAAALLVARNASGKIIWHSAKSYLTGPYARAPLDHKLPRNCGLR